MEGKRHIRTVPSLDPGKTAGIPSFRGFYVTQNSKKLNLVKSTWTRLSGSNVLHQHGTTHSSKHSHCQLTPLRPQENAFPPFLPHTLKTECSGVQAPVSSTMRVVGCAAEAALLETDTDLEHRRASAAGLLRFKRRQKLTKPSSQHECHRFLHREISFPSRAEHPFSCFSLCPSLWFQSPHKLVYIENNCTWKLMNILLYSTIHLLLNLRI